VSHFIDSNLASIHLTTTTFTRNWIFSDGDHPSFRNAIRNNRKHVHLACPKRRDLCYFQQLTALQGAHQIDVNLWMSQVLVTSIAPNDTILALDDGLLGNQVNSPVRIDDLGGVCEAHISVILFVVCLFFVNKRLNNQFPEQRKSRFNSLVRCV